MADNLSIVTVETAEGKFQQNVSVGDHQWLADEPESYGGTNTGPSRTTCFFLRSEHVHR